MIRISVKYVGHVQGVGFRYTTIEIAKKFAVAGYVQNMLDGSVQAIIEGDKKEITAFMQAIKERMSRNIETVIKNESEATGEFGEPSSTDTFTIRY
ncbi:acylphosphatase [Poriferisphaera sp. WC338]|uniref:acylphosphatase n=1 Tax=Poriferisphaera sp. WC338 TaxID=3425129 RepID=UPI003D813A73